MYNSLSTGNICFHNIKADCAWVGCYVGYNKWLGDPYSSLIPVA